MTRAKCPLMTQSGHRQPSPNGWQVARSPRCPLTDLRELDILRQSWLLGGRMHFDLKRRHFMMQRAAAVSAVFAAAIGITTASVQAAEYPERNVELVIPYPAGGGIDLLLRGLCR